LHIYNLYMLEDFLNIIYVLIIDGNIATTFNIYYSVCIKGP
jgi:hypothetical protein